MVQVAISDRAFLSGRAGQASSIRPGASILEQSIVLVLTI